MAAASYYITRARTVDWIPSPVLEPLNKDMTIQWDIRPVSRKESLVAAKDRPGFRLAQQHCTRCHLLPTPDQLPRETWPFVLTWMANYLGYRNVFGPISVNVNASLIPGTPLLPKEDYKALAEYYILTSKPEETLAKSKADRRLLSQFELAKSGPVLPPQTLTTLVYYEEAQRKFYIGSGSAKALAIYDQQGNLLEGVNVESQPVDIEILQSGFRLSVIGDFLKDQRKGTATEFTTGENGEPKVVNVVEGYHRLTQTISEDFNHDGTEDLLLVGFGEGEIGKVSIFWRAKDGSVTGEKVLISHSGALNAAVHDFDDNGLKDIMLLTSQSRQELLLFLDRGNGEFQQTLVSKQFAGFGYNHLAISDFNQDGLMDLLLVNGNNMEIKDAPLKPYHGVRILENRGDLKFEEKFFYRFDGALTALVEDFNKDGYLDIAAISFYPDWSLDRPETFLYLEGHGGYEFTPYTLPADAWGRWVSMSAADVDGDGYKDILLGGGYTVLGVHTLHLDHYQQLSQNKPSLVILRNKGTTVPGL